MVTCILKYRRNHPSIPDGPDRPVSENRWKSKANRAPRRLSDPNPTAHATSMVTRIMKRARSPPTHPTVQIVPPPVDRFKRDRFPDRNHLIRRSNGRRASNRLSATLPSPFPSLAEYNCEKRYRLLDLFRSTSGRQGTWRI
ncbi:hypothetical protein B296_00053958 [Ensete ventricosum]|uniref:Uncharacterized protein n=1 Tax=Ensete ventricosum TaxID=4639 RepID=A0A426Y5S9_ENSVE|nr:hypothetical protein B296_00053958 [Ensete ventricosum]